VPNNNLDNFLFICGFPSGGTDLTKLILNAHSKVCLTGELPNLVKMRDFGWDAGTVFNTDDSVEEFYRWLKKNDVYGNIRHYKATKSLNYPLNMNSLLQQLFCRKESAVWVGSKTPQFTQKLDVLMDLFPTAKAIIVVRDVRDVCLSWRNKWGKSMYYCAHKWAAQMKTGYDLANSDYKSRILIVKFEDLLGELKPTSERICDFLGIAHENSMLEHHKHVEEVPIGKTNYGKAIVTKNMNKWKNNISKRDSVRIEEIAFSAMQLYSYKAIYADSYKDISPIEKALGTANDIWAILFVGNRNIKGLDNIKNRLLSIYSEYKKRL
jgi:hypothetical protein